MRRDNCLLVRNIVTTVLEMILIERDDKGAKEFVRQTISDLLMNRLDLSLLVITKVGEHSFLYLQMPSQSDWQIPSATLLTLLTKVLNPVKAVTDAHANVWSSRKLRHRRLTNDFCTCPQCNLRLCIPIPSLSICQVQCRLSRTLPRQAIQDIKGLQGY